MIEVELPDGVIAEFPDEMSPDDIKGVLRKKFPSQQAPSLGESLSRPSLQIPYQPGMQTPGAFPPSSPTPLIPPAPIQEPQPASMGQEFIRGLNPFSKTEPSEATEAAMIGRESTAGMPPESRAARANELSRQYDARIRSFREQTMSPNQAVAERARFAIDQLQSERDAALQSIGVTSAKMFGGPSLPKATTQDVTTLTGIKGRPAAAIASGQRAVTGLTEMFATPEGMGLALPKAGTVIAKSFLAMMAKDAATMASEAAGRYSAGDVEGGDEALINATMIGVMLGIPAAKARGKNAAVELSRLLDKTELEPSRLTPDQIASLRLSLPPRAQVEMLPELARTRDLIDQALQEATQKVKVPGKQSAIEQLRAQTAEIEPVTIARAERIPGGSEAPYGKTSFMRPAEAPTTERTQKASAQEMAKIIDEIRDLEKAKVLDPELRTGVKQQRIQERIDAKMREMFKLRESDALIEQAVQAEAKPKVVDKIKETVVDKPVTEAKPAKEPSPATAKADGRVIYRAPATGEKGYWVKRGGQWYRADSSWKTQKKPIEPIALTKALDAQLEREHPPAPPVREMRPIEPGRGEEITAPSVENVRAQRELEARQKGAEEVPAAEGSPKAAEARVVTEKSLAEMSPAEQAKIGHEPGMEYGITLTEADVPRLEAGYAKAGKEMVDASMKGDGPGQQAAFGRMNFYGGALQGATRGKHTAAASNYELFRQRREAEGGPIPEPEPTVERVTSLDPQSGSPLSATDALINKLEALKFPEAPPETFFKTGLHAGFNLPHPEILRAVGRDAWNKTVDVAIASIKAGKAVAEAIDDGIAFLKTKVKDFDEAKARANIEYVAKAETKTQKPAVATPGETTEPTVTVTEAPTPTQVNLTPKILSNLTSQRGLPTSIFNEWAIGRGGFVKEQMNRTAHGIQELYRAIARQYDIGLGERMFKGLTRVPPEQVRMMNSYLRGEIDITAVPEGLRPTLSNLRAHIDALSNTMIREGLTTDKLAAVIGDNLGMYLRRSYRVFDDPKWGLKRLTTENQQRVVSGMLQELRRENPNATIQDALNNIEAVLNEYKRTGEEGSFFGKGSTIGSKDLSLFFKRKDISEWWRTMMGEYETPVANYAKTISKMARFIGDQRFLNAVEQAGVGKFLFEQPATGHTARIAAEGSPSLAPLSKYYTTPEIARAFREFYDRPSAANPVWQFIMRVTYASKVAKTVGSFLTQARNLLSQPFFWLRNGHWDVREAWPAIRSVYADVVGKEGAFLEYYRDAIRHGVANDTAQVGELRAVLKDVVGPRDFDVPVDLLAARSVAKTVRRAVVDPAERLYRTSDELGKLAGWEVEKFYLKKIRPEWSEAQIKNEAAIRVRNLYPTYSMISRFGKAAGKQPVFGPFISFPLEVIRTSYWAGKYASIDLASMNPWQKLRGAKMLAGQVGTYAGLFAIASAMRQMFGVTKEQDEDLRRFMPEWSKNAQLLYLGPIENGRAEYVNLSYINPFSYLIDPMVAVTAFDSGNYDERFWEAAKEFVRPFTSEQMTANAIVDLLRNQTESGRRVYNPEEDAPNKIKDVAKHIWEPIEPGTLTRMRRRIIPAIRGEQPVTGQELSVTRELVSELTGIKAEGNDVETGISFKLRGFNKAEEDVENIWRSKLLSGGTFPPEAIASEYERMNGIRRRVWEELREDILAAKRLGISDEKVSGMLKSAGLSAETQNKILAGEYRPYSPSVDLLKKAIERRKDIPESIFANDPESRIKLRQARAELAGDLRQAAGLRSKLSIISNIRKSKLSDSEKASRIEAVELR